MSVQPGLWKATPPGSATPMLLLVRRESDGSLWGRTLQSERRRRLGFDEGPGVALAEILGWTFEPANEEAA